MVLSSKDLLFLSLRFITTVLKTGDISAVVNGVEKQTRSMQPLLVKSISESSFKPYSLLCGSSLQFDFRIKPAYLSHQTQGNGTII